MSSTEPNSTAHDSTGHEQAARPTDQADDHHAGQAVRQIARRAKDASLALATASRARKDALLYAIADALEAHTVDITVANAMDMQRERAAGMSAGLLDRLALSPDRITAIAKAVRDVAALPDPIGDVVRGSTLANGLRLRQVRVPMGVIGMIYEARPNVTVDAASLALKAGSAVILRGGSAALRSNEVIVSVLRGAVEAEGFPADLVQSVDAYGRAGGVALMQARGLVDVLVPRGGAGLIQTVVRQATVPVIETGVGNVHIYVDETAELDNAADIVINAKTQRVGVCNAMETLLIHQQAALPLLARLAPRLGDHQVTIHGCDRTRQLLAEMDTQIHVLPATDEDWATEYLSLNLAVRVVESADQAMDHIRRWSSGHTEAILTQNLALAERFVAQVDSAAVIVNASTRFTDGAEFGLGAEIGISTQKLHARGPMGLSEITTSKWVVYGDGQVRP